DEVKKLTLSGELGASFAGLLTRLATPAFKISLDKDCEKGADAVNSRERKKVVDNSAENEKRLGRYIAANERFETAGLRVLTAEQNRRALQGNEFGPHWYFTHGSEYVKDEGCCNL